MLNEREKEIAAIAASVADHCQLCLGVHIEKAKNPDITEVDMERIFKIANTISSKGDENMMDFA